MWYIRGNAWMQVHRMDTSVFSHVIRVWVFSYQKFALNIAL